MEHVIVNIFFCQTIYIQRSFHEFRYSVNRKVENDISIHIEIIIPSRISLIINTYTPPPLQNGEQLGF